MKLKLTYIALLLWGFPFLTTAQNTAIQEGSHFVSGLFSYSSKGRSADFFSKDERLKKLNLSTKYQFFIADGLAVGGAFNFSRFSQDDYNTDFLRIGQATSYFFDTGSNTSPYLGAELGVNFTNMMYGQKGNGSYLKTSGGLSIRKNHMAFLFEVGLLYDKLKVENSRLEKGITLYSSIGIAGFLYSNDEY